MTLTELTESIAVDTGMPQAEVVKVLTSFKHEVISALIEGEQVKLKGFGTFLPKDPAPRKTFQGVMSVPRRTVRFRLAKTVQSLFPLSRRNEMEKYGVVIDEEKVKEAEYKIGSTTTGRISTKEPNLSNAPKSACGWCPKCGKNLEEPTKCVDCGTEPFEKREK